MKAPDVRMIEDVVNHGVEVLFDCLVGRYSYLAARVGTASGTRVVIGRVRNHHREGIERVVIALIRLRRRQRIPSGQRERPPGSPLVYKVSRGRP